MRTPPISRLHPEESVVLLLATVISITALIYFFNSGQILLYGDAVAHLNIARRVVDSLTPGPLQLGTVWLPFPHLLTLPLVWNDGLWQSGLAASIPSMIAYILGVLGMLRLGNAITTPTGARIATIIFAANPNLIYMQATAMTESIFLTTVVWAVYWIVQYMQAVRACDHISAARSLYKAAGAFLCAIFTRYDGWFIAALAVGLVLLVWMTARGLPRRTLLSAVRNFLLLMALGPAIWLTYNYAIFRNAMEFATGPYSARGVAERTTKRGDPPHPGFHSVQTAGTYFLKTARLNVGEGKREWWIPTVALIGALLGLFHAGMRPALLLWAPLPFYMLSIAYGGVPIFIPQWWPFSYYNVRYGLQLLPAFALFTGITLDVIRRMVQQGSAQRSILVVVLGAVTISYTAVWRSVPICLREARVNAVTRVNFETALAAELRRLPPASTLLMFTGSYVGALQVSGIHLRRVVSEGNYLIWDAALAQPSSSADYIVAVEGDAVALAVAAHPENMEPIARVHTPEKPPAVIYRSLR